MDALLSEAASFTAKYSWKEASESYTQALNQVDQEKDTPQIALIKELLAKCYFQFAMQAGSREAFVERMKQAISEYKALAVLYREAGMVGLEKRAEARGHFGSFWVETSPPARRGLLERGIPLAEESIQIFQKSGLKKELVETRLDLVSYLIQAMFLAPTAEVLRDMYGRATGNANAASEEFETSGDDEGLAESLYICMVLLDVSDSALMPESVKDLRPEIERLSRRIGEITKKVASPKIVYYAKIASGSVAKGIEGSWVKALELFVSASEKAEITRDCRLIGDVGGNIANAAKWSSFSIDDVEKRREVLEKGIMFSQKSLKCSQVPLDGVQLSYVYSTYPEFHTLMAELVETDAKAKKQQLQRAVEVARAGLIYAGFDELHGTRHPLSKALYYLATYEHNIEEKRILLNEALKLREEYVLSLSRLAPDSWDRGVEWNYLALLKAELAGLESNDKSKIDLLQSAVSDIQRGVDQCLKWARVFPWAISAIVAYQETYGDIVLQLYSLTGDQTQAQAGIKAYQDAIANYGKLDFVGQAPAIRWKIAKALDVMGDYFSAAASFKEAAADYGKAAGNLTGLRSTFEALSAYMEAWASIEQARIHHKDGQYSLAADAYVKARELLESSKMWDFLATHYSACSMLERGESFGREEKPEEAIYSFSASMEAFRECATTLGTRLKSASEENEQEELKGWISLSENRSRYCGGRRELEEANLYDKNGEKEASSRKYRSAAAVFKELSAEAANQQDRRELSDIELVCEARAKMKEAEAEASPELYAEAASMFMKSREGAPRSHGLQALADASLCRALEAGTRFRLTRDSQLYSEIKKHLETAGDYYHQAGLKSAADWARGTQRFFDALVYLADAEVERGREKKAEFYHLAEKHLELAAKLYDGAGYPKKKGEALNYLQKAREEKELLLTPMEVLSGNPASSGGTVTPVSLDRDQAKGLERFDEASLVGNMSVPRGDINVGADLTVELEIANLGKTSATLIKLENLAPEGLELNREMGSYQVEDGFINMRGKRLEYLKTDMVKIAMRAARKGAYLLKPRLLFVDERGNYKSFDFEPTPLTVKELGISGWLKGSGK